MKKIAMMNCLRANDVCAGASCLKAFNARAAGFERYAGEDVLLTAFMRCSGCGKTPEEDRGLKEKLERLVSEGTEAVHIGVCAQMGGKRCPTMEQCAAWLEQRGVEIIWRTH